MRDRIDVFVLERMNPNPPFKNHSHAVHVRLVLRLTPEIQQSATAQEARGSMTKMEYVFVLASMRNSPKKALFSNVFHAQLTKQSLILLSVSAQMVRNSMRAKEDVSVLERMNNNPQFKNHSLVAHAQLVLQ
jgi:hypothetical protein